MSITYQVTRVTIQGNRVTKVTALGILPEFDPTKILTALVTWQESRSVLPLLLCYPEDFAKPNEKNVNSPPKPLDKLLSAN